MRLDEFPSARAHRPLYPRPRRRPRGLLGVLFRVGVLLVLFVFVLTIAAAVVLASGPVEINALRDRVAAAAVASLGPGYRVDVARAAIDVDPVLGLVAEIRDIEVEDRAGLPVVNVPTLRLAIDPLSFLRLRVDITTVEITEPELSLVRDDAGKIYLGTADSLEKGAMAAPVAEARPAPPSAEPAIASIDGGFPNLFSALRILDGGLQPAIAAAFARNFERLAVDSATIHVWDEGRQQQRVFPHTDLALTLDAPSDLVKASFSTSGHSGRWGIVAERSRDPRTRESTLTLSFSQLTLADIQPNFGRPESLLSSDIPVFGRGTVRLAENGDVEDAMFRIDLGAGKVVSGFGKDTILLDEATIRLHWDVAGRSLVLEPSTFHLGDTHALLKGEVKPLGSEADGRYGFSLESTGAVLAGDSNAPPVLADRIALAGTADFPGHRIDIKEAGVTTPVGSVAAAGTLGLEGATPSLAMSASFTPMSLQTLKQLWPPILAGPARKWFLEHVIDGKLEEGRFEASVPGGVLWTGERVQMPEDYMRLDGRLSGVSFTTVGNVPPLTNVSGNVVLAGSTFGIDVDSGEVTAPSGRNVKLVAGAFAVENTAQPVAEAQIEAQLEGDVGAMAEVANSEPMRAMSRNKIDPADISGNGSGSLSIKLPLKPGLLPSDVDWRVALQTSDFASTAPIEGRIIRNGAFQMTANAVEVTIEGRATIDGVPVSIDLSRPLSDADGDGDLDSGRQKVQLVLDQAARKRLGIGLDNVLGGSVGATMSDLGDGRKGQHYELDLRQARLVLQSVGWSKGIGVPAKLSFDLIPREGGGFLVDNMVATGEGFGLKGKAALDAKFALVSADIDRLAFRKDDQISLKLARRGNGYSLTVRGSSFDARGLLAQLKASASSAGGEAADLSIDAEIEKVIGFGQVPLSSADISVEMRGGAVSKATLSGTLPGGAMSMNFADGGRAGAELALSSADAGGLFAFVDLYRRVHGGQLTLTGVRRGASGPFTGAFDVTSFALVDEASMRRLVSASTGTGGSTVPNGLDPDRVTFDRMRLDFTKRGSVIVVEDAVLRGASVGATFNGVIDLGKQTLSIVGTYLPAYAFNNLFGRLPVIGLALGGGNEGGLFGVTFKIEGPIAGPSLTVNPLSMITPGIFRKIFEFPVN